MHKLSLDGDQDCNIGCLQEGELGNEDQGQERNLIFLSPEAPCDAPSIIWVWEAIMVVFWEG